MFILLSNLETGATSAMKRQNDPPLEYEGTKKKGLSLVRWKQCDNNSAGKVSQPACLSSWKHFQTAVACMFTQWQDAELQWHPHKLLTVILPAPFCLFIIK